MSKAFRSAQTEHASARLKAKWDRKHLPIPVRETRSPRKGECDHPTLVRFGAAAVTCDECDRVWKLDRVAPIRRRGREVVSVADTKEQASPFPGQDGLPEGVPTMLEMAHLRLQAFKYFEGWGRKKEDGTFTPWTHDELQMAASKQIRWAFGRFFCSFCGKDQSEVKKIVDGWHGCICDECIALCVGIIAEGETAVTTGEGS